MEHRQFTCGDRQDAGVCVGWWVQVVVTISVSALVDAPIVLVGKNVFGLQKKEKYFKSHQESGRTDFLKTI